MAKLTDSQLIVLSAAAARDDGLAVAPAKMNKAAAAKIGSSLVACKLMREVKAKPGMAAWRYDEDGRPLSLMITKAGQKAIGVEESGTVKNSSGDKKSNRQANGGVDRTHAGKGRFRLPYLRKSLAGGSLIMARRVGNWGLAVRGRKASKNRSSASQLCA